MGRFEDSCPGNLKLFQRRAEVGSEEDGIGTEKKGRREFGLGKTSE